MSDATDKPDEETTAEDSQGPVGGERLAAARREQQISVLEIAKELHLDEPKVRALEKNDFEMLGAPVFAKGHLKKYASSWASTRVTSWPTTTSSIVRRVCLRSFPRGSGRAVKCRRDPGSLCS